MKFTETKLPGAFIIDLERREDDRGFFARVWCRKEFLDHGIDIDILQGNLSVNPVPGTLRGMHYQEKPYGEAKLVRCQRGAIYDVIVDLRPGSPTFRQWIGVELTAESHRMLYVPDGFAHGFQTLVENSEVNYLVSQYYTPDAGRGVRYDDPVLNITWPLPVSRISEQDKGWPLLAATVPAE
ncbi:dTDP-4-dehydrorhamnose 3,5-epimerase [uncultured Ferrovibrio sp.]|jgi:dTDP-4-dehydrorhamnose 3,5-epimerase|uniref:dTDP-4-dehydrorhamnose 3,5-epimerase n=1 Tax=uncultured Ferrovibrio sp. TaxID=1576913 RepID=UPI00260303FA|nr:dTDP-4-dehydrorhamnose 3,5-epimerase [uncultured Ferrovibrio sp.]